MVAGITLRLDYHFDTFLNESIDYYRSSSKRKADYSITSHICDIIEQDLSHPTFTYKNRFVFETSEESIIVSVNKDGVITHKIIVKETEYEIYLHSSLGEKLAELEYLLSGICFYEICLKESILTLHASAVKIKNEVLLFSAPSQTGKSTLADFVCQLNKTAVILNDDKPLIKRTSKGLMVYGSPWSGKRTTNTNASGKLKAILFLSQGKENILTELSTAQKITQLFRNIYRPREECSLEKLALTMDEVITTIPIYSYRFQYHVDSAKVLLDKFWSSL